MSFKSFRFSSLSSTIRMISLGADPCGSSPGIGKCSRIVAKDWRLDRNYRNRLKIASKLLVNRIKTLVNLALDSAGSGIREVANLVRVRNEPLHRLEPDI